MNSIIFRFYLASKLDYFEVCFDTRLSFKDNFLLLKDIYPINTSKLHIYDEKYHKFLALNTALSNFNFPYYKELLIL